MTICYDCVWHRFLARVSGRPHATISPSLHLSAAARQLPPDRSSSYRYQQGSLEYISNNLSFFPNAFGGRSTFTSWRTLAPMLRLSVPATMLMFVLMTPQAPPHALPLPMTLHSPRGQPLVFTRCEKSCATPLASVRPHRLTHLGTCPLRSVAGKSMNLTYMPIRRTDPRRQQQQRQEVSTAHQSRRP